MKYCTLILICCSLAYTNTLCGSTIKPFKNLGALSQAADLVLICHAIDDIQIVDEQITHYSYEVSVDQVIKGSLLPDDIIHIYSYKIQIGQAIRITYGDIHLELGKKYLVFLEEYAPERYRPIAMNYYVFEQVELADEIILTPNQDTKDLNFASDEKWEAVTNYNQTKLVNHLRRVVYQAEVWDMKQVKTDAKILGSTLRFDPPSYCNFTIGAPPQSQGARWPNFDNGDPVTIYGDVDVDLDKTNSLDLLSDAVGALMSDFGTSDINVVYGGSADFGGCTGNNVFSDHVRSWMNNNLSTGTESVMVVFNDPCDEIPGAYTGSGTIAHGGSWAYLPGHNYQGIEWYSAHAGYVVVQNGSGAYLSDANYTIMLEHELGHALGLGHIHDGTALMNPNCCNQVTNRDISCMSATYSSSFLPVEFMGYEAIGKEDHNIIQWKTAQEFNHDFYQVERSVNAIDFSVVSTVREAESVIHGTNNYESKDYFPVTGSNYYRIKQVDLDGKFEYSEVMQVFVEFDQENTMRVEPNPSADLEITLFINQHDKEDFSGWFTNLYGQKVKRIILKRTNQNPYYKIDISELAQGVYFITSDQNPGESLKFVKS